MCFLLVGNSDVCSQQLKTVLKTLVNPTIVAVDGGLRHLQHLGQKANIHLGDMDSTLNYDGADKKHILLDQETTDFSKALSYCGDKKPIVALGFSGKRIDHTLSVLTTMITLSASYHLVLLDSYQSVKVFRGKQSITVIKDTTVAVLTFSPLRFLHSKGLVWPLTNLELSPLGLLSTSNRSDDTTITLTPENDTPYMVCASAELWHHWL